MEGFQKATTIYDGLRLATLAAFAFNGALFAFAVQCCLTRGCSMESVNLEVNGKRRGAMAFGLFIGSLVGLILAARSGMEGLDSKYVCALPPLPERIQWAKVDFCGYPIYEITGSPGTLQVATDFYDWMRWATITGFTIVGGVSGAICGRLFYRGSHSRVECSLP